MPKVTAATVAVAGLFLIALTGCAGGTDSAGGGGAAPAVSDTAAPLVAETPDETMVEEDKAEEAFLAAFREIQTTYASVIPDATDQQLLDAGYEACERLAAGEASTDISLIEGEERNAQSEMYLDSVSIVGAAAPHLCG